MAKALYDLCRKDGTVMVYSITGPEVAAAIGCKLQDVYNSACYGQLIQHTYYAEGYSVRGMRLPQKNECVTTWWKLKHVMKRKGQLTVTYRSAALGPIQKEKAVVFGRETK